jgi:hypothetical protein
MQPVPHALSTNTGENTPPAPPDPARVGRRLVGRAVSSAGAFLVLIGLPFALIMLGAALFQDGPVAGVFAFLLCLVPVAVGIGVAHLGTPGFWRRPLDVRNFWRMPGVAGVGIALVTIPLLILSPDWALLTATLALCLYPLLDVPRILERPSWWRGAAVSVFVWLMVFGALTSVVEAVRHPREDSMIFLLPFMMYPLVLAISGVVRFAGRASGRTFESAPRVAAIVGAVACVALVAVPVGLSVIPVLVGKITGNSPPNSVTSEDGDVVSAGPGEFSVHLASGSTKSLRLGPETKFDFRGPGSALVKGPPAGPSWLKAGQRVGLEYVTRGYVDRAERVNIWIERKGCRGDEKWETALRPDASGPTNIASLAGSTWASRRASQSEANGNESTTFEFLAGNRLTYQSPGGTQYTDGAWKQEGPAVRIEVNDCYAEYEGRIEGDTIKGEFWNEVGAREEWTARLQGSVSAGR